MEYLITKQHETDERVFYIKDKDGIVYLVDLYTDGAFSDYSDEDTKDDKTWRNWLANKFLGKKIYIEKLSPYIYFTAGEQKLLN